METIYEQLRQRLDDMATGSSATKSEDALYLPPETGMETYIRIAKECGKL